MKIKKVILSALAVGAALLCAMPFFADFRRNARAADHAGAPAIAHDAGADLAEAGLDSGNNRGNAKTPGL